VTKSIPSNKENAAYLMTMKKKRARSSDATSKRKTPVVTQEPTGAQ
jgi:hypothetical protein